MRTNAGEDVRNPYSLPAGKQTCAATKEISMEAPQKFISKTISTSDVTLTYIYLKEVKST